MALVVGTNAYADGTAADLYFEDSLRKDTWKDNASGQRDRALVEATRILETFRYLGTKTSDVQELSHPRDGLSDRNDIAIANTEVAPDMLEAMYELGFSLLDGSINLQGQVQSNVKRQKLDVLEQEFFEVQRASSLSTVSGFPTYIRDLIKIYLNSGTLNGVFSSGTEESSSLDPCPGESAFNTPSGQFDRSKGFG